MTDQATSPLSLQTARTLLEEGSFEETLATLEAVVDHLERGRLALAESVAWYEVGLALSRRCTDLLGQAEIRISELETEYGLTAEPRDYHDDEET
jgi:exodeoxyribonuclease VII small subunit